MLRRVLAALVLGLAWLPIEGLSAPAESTIWLRRAWQSDDGLPDNTVVGVAQTPDGFLWVATAGGLMRFDGARFTEFALASLEGVPNRVVRAMTLDRVGSLWLAMDRGVVVCIGPDGTHVYREGLPDGHATSIVCDAQGAVWMAYIGGGLARIQEGHARLMATPDAWPCGIGTSLTTDIHGQLWCAKSNSVGVFRSGEFHELLKLGEAVSCIGRRRGGGVWLCAGKRLLRFEEGSEVQEWGRLGNGPETVEPRTLLEDRFGMVWIGTAGSGLYRCGSFYPELIPTTYHDIICLAEDREGNIWAGTGGGGLNRLRPRIVELMGTESGLPYESVRSVCEDDTGAIWVATQNGLLARLSDSGWTTLSKDANWPAGHFSCVAAGRRGGLWLGTHDHGLFRYEDGRFTNWQTADGLASEDVRSILPASSGDIWIATTAPTRFQRIRDGHLQTLELPVGTRSLRALAEDEAGRVWAGSADGVLLRVEGDHILNATPLSKRMLSIRWIYPTPDGSLWIGYAGWGLGRLKDGKYSRITAEQGLYDDYISQMVADDVGGLWCAGNRGIFQVQLQQLNAVAEGRAERVRSIVYGRGEDLPNQQANYENYPGAMRSRDGRLWFPMLGGLAVVHTANIQNNPYPPPVLLERVALDGQTLALYDTRSPLPARQQESLVSLQSTHASLTLPPNHRKLDIDFTALSLTAPENVQFQYRLDKLDSDWIEADRGQRSASYSRLPPARYRFLVRACNNAGVWNQTGASLDILVDPFYWQTWWFRAAAVSAFTIGLVAIVRYLSFRRLRRQLRLLEQQASLQRERARIAKDIHDDLGADLAQIAYMGELARQDQAEPEKAAQRIDRISATARRAIKSLDEIVWAVNPRNDTLAHLIDYAGQFAVDYLSLAGIRCRLDFPDLSPAHELSTDLRHNLFLAVKEALHNVVKHAGASEVWLRANYSEQALDMQVEDNGRGFDSAPDNAKADGLRNMRQRLEGIGGSCRIVSQTGAGTKVLIHLPWPNGNSGQE